MKPAKQGNKRRQIYASLLDINLASCYSNGHLKREESKKTPKVRSTMSIYYRHRRRRRLLCLP